MAATMADGAANEIRPGSPETPSSAPLETRKATPTPNPLPAELAALRMAYGWREAAIEAHALPEQRAALLAALRAEQRAAERALRAERRRQREEERDRRLRRYFRRVKPSPTPSP